MNLNILLRSAQFGRILAQKRGLTLLWPVICGMHDIYVFTTGRVTDHAHKGAPIARKVLEKTKKFTAEEIKLITSAIYNHSDKHIVSKNPYAELVKDADVLDCGLFDGALMRMFMKNRPKTVENILGALKRCVRNWVYPGTRNGTV